MQIISTKLTIPPLRSRFVRRSRLIEKLNQGFEAGFLLISAPAGYGKSTLLSAWLSQCHHPSAWLSLDENDNDLVRFLAYLAAALHGIDPSLSQDMEISLQASPLPAVDVLLTPLVNNLSLLEQPFCLVLDDYHLIQEQSVHQAIGFLLEHRPASLHLTIATRADPPLPLARMRARAEMVEVRLSELRFTDQEAGEFLNHTMGVQISAEDVARITTRTEGWIAGLQIAALSMQNTEDVSGFITSLSGSDYYIFDYLLKEILAHQSPEIQRFLLYTSILDQLTAPLCDALLVGDPDSAPIRPSAVILEELEHANLFLIPLDYEHRWFRYHHLFADLLRVILEQTYPGQTVQLHRRACRWYETQGMIPTALEHAISSGDMQLVAQIASANVLVLVEDDEVLPTLQKIDSLPPDEMITLPWLGIARAWILGTGQTQQSQHILDAVEVSVENMPDSDERQRLKGHIAAARAFVLGAHGDTVNTIAYAKLANELLPSDEIAVRALNLTRWGDVLIDRENDFISGIPILEQALVLALQAKKPHVAMIASAALASALMHAGRLHEVQHVCLEALVIAEDYQRRYQRPLSVTAEIYSILARVFAEWGEFEEAVQFACKGLALSERWGEVFIESLCLSHLGRILVLCNDYKQACQVFQRADRIVQRITPWYWQAFTLFALDSLLDSEAPVASDIADQIRRVQESGAHYSLLLKARLLLRDDQPDLALTVIEQALAELNGPPSYDTVRIYALQALAYQAKGKSEQSLTALQQALALGEPENRVACFVREGAEMERLLRVAQAKGLAPQFVARLLTAFEARRKAEPVSHIQKQALIEPLSSRELEVLKLLSQGCADKQIAERLVISPETVHKHLKNIYEKLDVHSRTEAIARGLEVGLL